MRIPNLLIHSALLVTTGLALWLTAACSVSVKKDADQREKNVDINTPIGGIHVSQDTDPRDVGLPVYPGARIRQQAGPGDQKTANVNIATAFFGLKVVAQEYESDDSSEKLISYYSNQLKKYGGVLECHSSWRGKDVSVKMRDKDKDSGQLTCDESTGNATELKVGTRENQHIVAIEREGKGSKFALVYVQIHGKDGMI